eukprot:CAMPEP_0170569548 /NCGR_PEP_ID=MMETSP0224-20130122/609_1 /TAXON_ID=285029 /ORGANISM="Togula jolla, Strain CCCM 725" /LENGTH=50 /DNA_ID=CAMNT_0010891713 /DNA_START=173 /DNA_END=325 /DNA_ORIENTATION=-
MLVCPVHVYLRHQMEATRVLEAVALYEGLDLRGVPRLLTPELIAGKSHDV